MEIAMCLGAMMLLGMVFGWLIRIAHRELNWGWRWIDIEHVGILAAIGGCILGLWLVWRVMPV